MPDLCIVAKQNLPTLFRYFIAYKPYGMLSQFSKETPEQQTLADLDFEFPKDAYPVGRLDADSEGMLLITNDKTLNARLLNPKFEHPRSYWAQVEGIPTEEALTRLRTGVQLRIDGKEFTTLPAKVRLIEPSPTLPERTPPIRVRQSIPDRWIELTLTEGKNRQVRRMCAAVGHPVLRLVRVRIGHLGLDAEALGDLLPGAVSEIPKSVVQNQILTHSS
ncbi:MAG: pseudouridine synthase [Bacteroidota bacterium]